MKIFFIGTVQISYEILKKLIFLKKNIVGIFTNKKNSINSDFFDLSHIAKENKIKVFYGENINDVKNINFIKELNPDLIICVGWSHILKSEILNIPKLGVIGFHPSKLPENRGKHPIIWSLVLGKKETASTFFFMNEFIDKGNIISQKPIKISYHDDAKSLYTKIIKVSVIQIEKIINDLQKNILVSKKQKLITNSYWRKRTYLDGQIDWRMDAEKIYFLVRGLTKPYVGAHFIHKDTEYKVWKVLVKKDINVNIEPGKIISKNNSKVPIIKCGKDAIKLVEITPKIILDKVKYI